jgi:hypothetical protein
MTSTDDNDDGNKSDDEPFWPVLKKRDLLSQGFNLTPLHDKDTPVLNNHHDKEGLTMILVVCIISNNNQLDKTSSLRLL